MSSPDLSPDTSLNPPKTGRTVYVELFSLTPQAKPCVVSQVELLYTDPQEILELFSFITPIPIIVLRIGVPSTDPNPNEES
jgi:hypothetical protein